MLFLVQTVIVTQTELENQSLNKYAHMCLFLRGENIFTITQNGQN